MARGGGKRSTPSKAASARGGRKSPTGRPSRAAARRGGKKSGKK